MFAIAFDLVVADTEQHHPKGYQQPMRRLAQPSMSMGFAGYRAVFM